MEVLQTWAFPSAIAKFTQASSHLQCKCTHFHQFSTFVLCIGTGETRVFHYRRRVCSHAERFRVKQYTVQWMRQEHMTVYFHYTKYKSIDFRKQNLVERFVLFFSTDVCHSFVFVKTCNARTASKTNCSTYETIEYLDKIGMAHSYAL